MSNIKQFVGQCTLTFKAFEHDVVMTEGKATLWNFITLNRRNGRRYAIFCTQTFSKSKSLVKIALKKLPKDHRLVVITNGFNEEELAISEKDDFCLTSLEIIKQFGDEMLDIKNRLPTKNNYDDEISSLIDMAIQNTENF